MKTFTFDHVKTFNNGTVELYNSKTGKAVRGTRCTDAYSSIVAKTVPWAEPALKAPHAINLADLSPEEYMAF